MPSASWPLQPCGRCEAPPEVSPQGCASLEHPLPQQTAVETRLTMLLNLQQLMEQGQVANLETGLRQVLLRQKP